MGNGEGILKGALILGVAGIFVKLLGAMLRIPITNLLGEGMSYYSVAYAVYSVLLVLATAGIPVAISKMVSERVALEKYADAKKVFHICIYIMGFVGVISFSVCFFGADLISQMMKVPKVALSIKAIAPALLFVPLLAAFRGYMQGWSYMQPTAISEIIEQIVRVIIGLLLTYTLISYGKEVGAAGATLGASVGALAGFFAMIMLYNFFFRRKIEHNVLSCDETESSRSIAKEIATIAFPIVIGAEIMPLMETVDATMVMRRLQETGWTLKEAEALFSQYGGFCNSLISFPQLFTQAVAVSLIPVISGAYGIKNYVKTRENVTLAMRLTTLMGFPCAVGIFVLAEPVLLLMYPYQRELALSSVTTLKVMTIGVVFLAIAQTSAAVLQSIGRPTEPVKHLFYGAMLKLVLTYWIVGIQIINVLGAAIGTIAAYVIACVLNCCSIRKQLDFSFNVINVILKPGLIAVSMGIIVHLTFESLSMIMPHSIATIISIVIGIISYIFLVFYSQIITEDELLLLPGGGSLARLKKSR